MANQPDGAEPEQPPRDDHSKTPPATAKGDPSAPRSRSARRQVKARRPWDQREGEGARAFEAATAYFDLGPERSLREVARSLSKSLSLIGRWSAEWDWTERARAYDASMAQAAQEKRQRDMIRWTMRWTERREALREREWEVANAFLTLAEKVLARETRYSREHTVHEAALLVSKASTLARRAAEMPASPPALPRSDDVSSGLPLPHRSGEDDGMAGPDGQHGGFGISNEGSGHDPN